MTMPHASRAAFEAPRHAGRFLTWQTLDDDVSTQAKRAPLDITLSLHTNLAAVEKEWREFERDADATVFQCFDWLAAWQSNIGIRNHTVPAIVFGHDPQGTLLFIMPFAIEPGAIGRLRWLGSDLADYNAPLLHRRFSACLEACFAELWTEITALLVRHGMRYDVVDFSKMPELVGGQRNPFLQLPATLHPSGAYLTRLGGDWDEFYKSKRSSSSRKRDRGRVRRLAEYGKACFVSAETPEEAAASLAILIDQKARAFERRGIPNLFARAGYREFFFDVATRPTARGLTHISRLDVGTLPAALNFGLIFQDCYYHVLASYDEGEVSRCGPGVAHLHNLLAYAVGRGLKTFDFTIGDEPYKREWCDVERKLYDHVSARTWRGRPWAISFGVWLRLKRLIKQNPALWAAANGFRSLMGSIGRPSTPENAASPKAPKSNT